ncbi:hypothetical protein [Prosthecodimorpha staleyi]|uniref:Uncharacterized protein n=1 Tax=Prosthecodimorpha staleyi TaxID=2840188 RepID=A0A947GFJ9_9HYPH|nr:hypothetical protein [Prosthecodimorpha staleyi]MBT9290660.1 hypothetical protein [Prosthecodimorpha staleyi]
MTPDHDVPDAYSVRNALFERPVTWRLQAGRLRIDAGMKQPVHLDYADIVTMRLVYDPKRTEWNRQRCTITVKTGERFTIASVTCLDVIRIAPQTAAYAGFVRALARRIAAANPACRFVAGKPAWLYTLMLAAPIPLIGVPLAWLASVTGKVPNFLFYATALLVIAGIPWLYTLIRHRPRTFDPQAIADGILPR